MMKDLMTRFQKDLAKLQTTLQKEGNDLLKRVKKVDLKDNLSQGKKELEALVESKLKKLEPAYHNFIKELRKNVKKAGIDIDKLEKELRKTATIAKKKIGSEITKTLQKRTKTKKKKSSAAGAAKAKAVSRKTKAGTAVKKARKSSTMREATT